MHAKHKNVAPTKRLKPFWTLPRYGLMSLPKTMKQMNAPIVPMPAPAENVVKLNSSVVNQPF